MAKLIGREYEQDILNQCIESDKSEFVAIFGRRRIGKTFLIREFFKNNFFFYFTGVYNVLKEQQFRNFNTALKHYSKVAYPYTDNWFFAFEQLTDYISETKNKGKKVIFIDELSWLDTHKSGFLQALEYFWNSFASARKDILLVVCASATSWLINRIIKNKGGLHNRVTQQIALQAFTLYETELFLKSKKIEFTRKQIIEYYMVLGGVPFYLDFLKKNKSVAQNIDALFFADNAPLRNEFSQLFDSLFGKADKHIHIITALSKKKKGLNREEILKLIPFADGGSVSRILEELEQCGFIRIYNDFDRKIRNRIYQLIDFYSLFYLNFIHNEKQIGSNYWTTQIDNPKYRAWTGYSYEQVCMWHIQQIKSKLGISGVTTQIYSWRSRDAKNGAQIDLLIKRNDRITNVCEIKFSNKEFTIDKKYDEILQNKKYTFIEETQLRDAVHLTLISTYGVKHNAYWNNIQSEIVMNDLFAP
jgi:AAA+ ATPase superfamily predicted ATPase